MSLIPSGWSRGAIALCGNDLYMYLGNFATAVKIDIDDGETEYLFTLDDKGAIKSDMYNNIVRKNGYVFFVPYDYDVMTIFDIRTKTNEYIKLDKTYRIRQVFVHEQYIYMFPEIFGEGIIKYDIGAKRVVEVIKNELVGVSEYTGIKIAVQEDKIYIPIYKKSGKINYYYIFWYEKNILEKKEKLPYAEGYEAVEVYGNKLLFVESSEKRIVEVVDGGVEQEIVFDERVTLLGKMNGRPIINYVNTNKLAILKDNMIDIFASSHPNSINMNRYVDMAFAYEANEKGNTVLYNRCEQNIIKFIANDIVIIKPNIGKEVYACVIEEWKKRKIEMLREDEMIKLIDFIEYIK